MTNRDFQHRYTDRPPSGLAEGAIAAFVVGITLGLGILFWGTSSHDRVASTNTSPQNQAAPATTGQGNPAALEQSVPSKTPAQSKERRGISDIPATEQQKPAMQDSNVPPAGSKR